MNFFQKQRQNHRHREQTYGYERGKRQDKSGAWNQQIQTIMYKIDKQQGPTVQHRELYSLHCNNLEKNVKKEFTHIYAQLNHFAVYQ